MSAIARAFCVAFLVAFTIGGCARLMTIDPELVPGRNQPDWQITQGSPLAAQPQPPPAFAQQSQASVASQRGNKRLAVLEFQGKNLDQDILMTFSDTVRGGALQGLSGRGVVVMTRENMLVLLKDMGKKDCGEGECEVETARNIGADYVVSGKVVRMEKIYVVTLKLHETQGGSLLGTNTVEGANQVELMRTLREQARQLTQHAFSASR